jgi:co-chaperonin GroES (HSP10)
MKLRPLKGKVLVKDIEKGIRIISGFIIPNDDGKSAAIRPHWAQVYAVGPDVKEISPGQWILIEHARWTRSIKVKDENGDDLQLWGVEYPQAVMCVADEKPTDVTIFSKFA